MKYIDSEKLIAEIERRIEETKSMKPSFDQFWAGQISAFKGVRTIIDSLRQDKDTLDLCSQVWWEDRGWIMIPPNVTLKGIESLLEKVRHKIKWNEENGIEEQEQPEEDIIPLPEGKMVRYINYCLHREDDDCNCPTCGEHVTGLRLFPYYYDRENNDVYFASVCPECGKIIISKE